LSASDLTEQVTKTPEECREYWIRSRVPRFLIDELIVDLESHIEGAVSHGKRPEEAIRSAREWAIDQAEDCRRPPQWKDRALSWSASILYTSAFAIVPQHMFHSTLAFPLGPSAITLIVLLVTAVRLLSSPRLSFLIFNPLRRKGFLSFGDYWFLCAGMLVGVFVPLRSIGESSPALLEWSWVHSLTLIAAAVAVGIADHRRDPTRPSPALPAIAQSPGLVPTDEAFLERKRKCDRVALGSALSSTFCFTVTWSLVPPGARDAVGLWLVLSVYWLLLLAYLELLGRPANENAAST
jgi:hypothetical protein